MDVVVEKSAAFAKRRRFHASVRETPSFGDLIP